MPLFYSLDPCPLKILDARLNSKIKKSKKKRDQLVFLGKCALNKIEVLYSKTLVNSVICHDEFALINNVLKEYDKMK